MSWRPPQSIRIKAIGICFHRGRLLVGDVTDDAGSVKGRRPLGGTIEFGETREQALHREFLEELGVRIRIVGPWRVFENIYSHEGQQGHEMVFAARIDLLDASLYDRDEIDYAEADGMACRARWMILPSNATSGPALYPEGLGAALQEFLADA